MESAELDNCVEKYLAERGTGAVPAVPPPKLSRTLSSLDAIWWKKAEEVLLRAAGQNTDRMLFSPKERLFLDLGLLDYRLIPGGESCRPELLREIFTPGPAGSYYFSEWLAQRFRQRLLYGRMSTVAEEPRKAPPPFREVRLRLYARLAPLFANLPGINRDTVRLFINGSVDETLDAMSVQLERSPDERTVAQRTHLQEMRNQILARARDRARGEEDLTIFDAIKKLDQQVEAERFFGGTVGGEAEPEWGRPEEREEYVRSELRLARSLLNLGVASKMSISGSTMGKAMAVLVHTAPRLTKTDLAPVFDLIRDCDPMLPRERSVLIAPYQGDGFYEWDRDTIFVPLHATCPPDEAAVTAFAIFRIMLDTLQQGGRLRREYTQAFGKEDFHACFLRDYKAWVLGIGKGQREALDPKRFDFFCDTLGPRPGQLFAPREWITLTPDEWKQKTQECIERVSRGEAGFEDRFYLAVVHSREHRPKEAVEELKEALRLSPLDGRALVAAGHLAGQTGDSHLARGMFEECRTLAPGTIWAVYAEQEMAKL